MECCFLLGGFCGFFFFSQHRDFGIFELKPYVWVYAAHIQCLTSFTFNTLLN